jgi:hypothetical protein
MKKVIRAALLLSTLTAMSAQAGEAIYTWRSKALDKQLGTPIEGVKFSWTFTDKSSGKITNDECLTNSEGMCEVKAVAESGFFSGSRLAGNTVFAKEGYEKLAEIEWLKQDDELVKFLVVKMTNSAVVEAAAAEKEKRAESLREAAAVEQAEIKDLRVQLLDAELKSVVICGTKMQCDKLFALTEIYISKSADMKIQLVTATTIETHNPTDTYKVAMSAYRVPSEGNSSMVSIKTVCKDGDKGPSKLCLTKQLEVMKGYKPFVAALLKK